MLTSIEPQDAQIPQKTKAVSTTTRTTKEMKIARARLAKDQFIATRVKTIRASFNGT